MAGDIFNVEEGEAEDAVDRYEEMAGDIFNVEEGEAEDAGHEVEILSDSDDENDHIAGRGLSRRGMPPSGPKRDYLEKMHRCLAQKDNSIFNKLPWIDPPSMSSLKPALSTISPAAFYLCKIYVYDPERQFRWLALKIVCPTCKCE